LGCLLVSWKEVDPFENCVLSNDSISSRFNYPSFWRQASSEHAIQPPVDSEVFWSGYSEQTLFLALCNCWFLHPLMFGDGFYLALATWSSLSSWVFTEDSAEQSGSLCFPLQVQLPWSSEPLSCVATSLQLCCHFTSGNLLCSVCLGLFSICNSQPLVSSSNCRVHLISMWSQDSFSFAAVVS
jgi:hypothetical protein